MANKNQMRKRAEHRKSAKNGGAGVVSSAPKRNMQMVIRHNTDNQGKKMSNTSHEAIHSDRPIVFKGHNYIKYNAPRANRSK